MNALALACRAIDKKKGEDLTVLDVRKISSFTDFFAICHGNSRRQTRAISEAIVEALKAEGISASHVEGKDHGEWILLDYIDFVIHIFSREARQFYKLERLWSDGIPIEPRALSA